MADGNEDRLIDRPQLLKMLGDMSFMLVKTLAALAFTTGVVLSGSALADPAKFDGTWSVQLVAEGGLCGGSVKPDPGGPERQRAGGRLRGERIGAGWAKRVRQPGSAEERRPRLRLRQAVGFVRLRLVDRVIARVLGPVDGSTPHPHRPSKLMRGSSSLRSSS